VSAHRKRNPDAPLLDELSRAVRLIEERVIKEKQRRRRSRLQREFFLKELYSALQLVIEMIVDAQQEPGSKRGRPAEYDWTEFTKEAYRQLRTLAFTKQADLVRKMSDWCGENWKEPPDASQLKEVTGLVHASWYRDTTSAILVADPLIVDQYMRVLYDEEERERRR
jgi:hypothetical protein